MDWNALHNRLVNQYHEQPQVTTLVALALRQAKEAIENLARLGHQFHLAEGTAPPLRAFPRMVYHLTAAPRGHLCLCEEDLSWLGEGWFDTFDEAKHADGLGHQYRRGGIFPKRGLPAIIDAVEPTRLDRLEGRQGPARNGRNGHSR